MVTKQEIVDEISDSLQIGPFKLGAGSTEPREFFEAVLTALGITKPSDGAKPNLARAVVEGAGLSWDQDCDSTLSKSMGGGTVTRTGLERLRQAVELLREQNRSQMPSSETIDVTPKAGALKLFRNLSFTLPYALGEFIDNSITSLIQNRELLQKAHGPNYGLRIDIDWDELSNKLVVTDNAAGIARKDIDRALRVSVPPPNIDEGLSLHGVGMKAAAFWLGQRLEIETTTLEDGAHYAITMDLAEIEKDSNVRIRDLGESKIISGTRVSCSNLWRGQPNARTVKGLMTILPAIYRNFISNEIVGNVESMTGGVPISIFVNGQRLEYIQPEILQSPVWPREGTPGRLAPVIYWKKGVSVRLDNGKTVSGWVGLLEKLSRDRSGFVLSYRGKAISGATPNDPDNSDVELVARGAYRPRKIFGQRGSAVDLSLIGEFDVSSFGKSITTDSVVWTDEEENQFLDLLNDSIRNDPDFITQAKRVKRRKIRDLDDDDKIAVENEVSILLASSTQFGLNHDEVILHSDEDVDGDGFPDHFYKPYTIQDDENHQHTFKLYIARNPEASVLTISSDDDQMKHVVVVNPDARAFSSLPPVHGESLKLFIRLLLGFSIAEVFTDGLERDRVRNKANEWFKRLGDLND
jgi:Histidine kinase-, DNA gyrase B-, and HSP90-like ATPase